MGVLILRKSDGTEITNGIINLRVGKKRVVTAKTANPKKAVSLKAVAHNNTRNVLRTDSAKSLDLKKVREARKTGEQNTVVASVVSSGIMKTIEIKQWKSAQKYVKDNAKSMVDLLMMSEGETRTSVLGTINELKAKFQ